MDAGWSARMGSSYIPASQNPTTLEGRAAILPSHLCPPTPLIPLLRQDTAVREALFLPPGGCRCTMADNQIRSLPSTHPPNGRARVAPHGQRRPLKSQPLQLGCILVSLWWVRVVGAGHLGTKHHQLQMGIWLRHALEGQPGQPATPQVALLHAGSRDLASSEARHHVHIPVSH